MKSTFGNKRASIMDPITVGAVLLSIILTAFIMLYVWNGFSDQMRIVVDDSVANETVQETLDNLDITYSYIDYMIPMLVGGLMIISLVFAFKTGASVVYAFLSLIAWGFALLMANVYTDVFETFAETFPTIAANNPIMVFVMTNFKWIVLGWVFLISVVMFTRNKQEDAQLSSGLQKYYA